MQKLFQTIQVGHEEHPKPQKQIIGEEMKIPVSFPMAD